MPGVKFGGGGNYDGGLNFRSRACLLSCSEINSLTFPLTKSSCTESQEAHLVHLNLFCLFIHFCVITSVGTS